MAVIVSDFSPMSFSASASTCDMWTLSAERQVPHGWHNDAPGSFGYQFLISPSLMGHSLSTSYSRPSQAKAAERLQWLPGSELLRLKPPAPGSAAKVLTCPPQKKNILESAEGMSACTKYANGVLLHPDTGTALLEPLGMHKPGLACL